MDKPQENRFKRARIVLNQWGNSFFGEWAYSGDTPRKQIAVIHMALGVVDFAPAEVVTYNRWLELGNEHDGARKLAELGSEQLDIPPSTTDWLRSIDDPAQGVIDEIWQISRGFPNFLRNRCAVEATLATSVIVLCGVHGPKLLASPDIPGSPLLAS